MKSSATNQKISWFRREDDAGMLDLRPQFQRRPVWTEEQQSYLIDTILSGLPIPEIYFRSTSSPQGETRFEVIDGQQRIRSVLLFGLNDLELTGDLVSAKWAGKRFEDLTDSEKTEFWDYNIVTRDVSGATDIEIRDLFKRLNLVSIGLNDQELRHARYSGRFIKAMEFIADDKWWLDTGVVNLREVRRMVDVEFISELFIGLIAGPQDKKKTLDEFYEDYEASIPQESEWMEEFERARELIRALILPEELRKWKGKSDFYTLFLTLANFSQRTPRLTSNEREAVRSALSTFCTEVDQAKRKDNTTQFARDVHEYVEAVTRAASDLGRRNARLRVLEERMHRALTAAGKRAKGQSRAA